MTDKETEKLFTSSPRKRKFSPTPASRRPLHTTTIRSLPYSYLRLSLITISLRSDPLDAITARKYLTSALQQFLGVTGTAIPIDILKVEDRDVWIRVPREDGNVVTEAMSGWSNEIISWRVIGKSEWLGGLVAGNGRALFD